MATRAWSQLMFSASVGLLVPRLAQAQQEPLVEPAPVEAPAAEAAEEPKPPTFSGHVEAAYHLNLSDSDTAPALRSYDGISGNTFQLHAAHLAISHAFSDWVSATVEIDAGTDPLINGAPLLGWFDVQEAYATLTAPYGLSLTAGKFVTYEGIEVIEGPSNPTLTRGFLFGLAEAFTHVGAKLHYAVGDMADIGVGVVNGWDQMVDNNTAKTIIWRIGVTPAEMFAVGFSGSWGAERTEDLNGDGAPDDLDANDDARLSLDVTGSVTPIEMLSINFQLNYGRESDVPTDVDPITGDILTDTDASWWGFGIQPLLSVDAFLAGLRIEYFNDSDGGVRAGTDDASYWNFTITPGYTVAEAFTLRAEYRVDLASEDALNGENTQHTIAVGAHYVF